MADDGTLLKNTAYNVLARGIASGVPLVVSMYASRRIGVDSFGIAQYIIWLVSTVWMFLNFGLPITLVRYIALRMGDRNPASAGAMIGWSLVFNGLICIAGALVFLIALHMARGLWIETLLLFICMSFNSVLQSAHEGLMRFRRLFFASLVSGCVMLVLFFPLIHPYVLDGYIAVLVAGAAVNALVLLFSLKDLPLFHREMALIPPGAGRLFGRDVRSFALYTWLAAIISSFAWQRMELFFIKTYLTTADVAFFSVAVLLATYVTQPIALLSSALIPYFSRAAAEHNEESAHATYFFLTKLLAWLTFFACFFVAAHSSFIVKLIYGIAYEPAENVTAIVVAGSSFGAIAAAGSALLYAHGRSRFIVLSGSVGAVLAVFSGIFIVPIFGIVGAAIARILIQFLMICFGTYYIVTRLKFSFPFFNYIKSLVLAAMICFIVQSVLPVSSTVQFFINAIIALLLYAIGTHLLTIFRKDEISKLKRTIITLVH
jgi:O-antigen/teichoic acid export membrane protein